jgi:hypothetical protein
MVAVREMSSRMEARESAPKIVRSLRLVKMSVLEGGVGCDRGGRVERSSVRLDFLDALEEEREARVLDSNLGSIAKGRM